MPTCYTKTCIGSCAKTAGISAEAEEKEHLQERQKQTHHCTSSQEDEAWHSLCLVHASYVSEVIKVIPNVVLEEQHSSLLLTVFVTEFTAVLQHLLASTAGLQTHVSCQGTIKQYSSCYA